MYEANIAYVFVIGGSCKTLFKQSNGQISQNFMMKVKLKRNTNVMHKSFFDIINPDADIIELPKLNNPVRDPCLLIENGYLFVLFGKTFELEKDYKYM